MPTSQLRMESHSLQREQDKSDRVGSPALLWLFLLTIPCPRSLLSSGLACKYSHDLLFAEWWHTQHPQSTPTQTIDQAKQQICVAFGYLAAGQSQAVLVNSVCIHV
jgi:hypothetical protein